MMSLNTPTNRSYLIHVVFQIDEPEHLRSNDAQ